MFTVSYAKNKPDVNQNEKDSIECLKNYSIYVINLKKDMYDYAVEPWNFMFKNCPDIGVRIYSDGIKIYEHYYDIAKSLKRKAELVDTMMMIYDQRIKFFGSHPKYPEGWILGRKAVDLVKYKRSDVNALKEAYSLFKISFEKLGDKAEDVVLFNWLKTSLMLYKNGDQTDQQFLYDFLTISTVLETQFNKSDEKANSRIEQIRTSCEDLLVKSGAGDCNSLEPLLTDQFNIDSENSENIERIINLLEKLDCKESALYYNIIEKNYQLNPSHKSAYQLAKMFVRNNNFAKAEEYYNRSIEGCDDETAKSKYYYELAVLEFAHNKNYPKARNLARKAIALKGDWGKPFMLIGNIYAVESKKYGTDDFEHSTLYWVALDSFSKAKEVDPDCTKEANEQILLYSKYLPDKESGFFHGLKEGDPYVIGSWINERTKVRFRQ